MTGAVITGLGVAAPTGLGKEQFWDATRSGSSVIGRITRFDPSGYPATLAGEIRDFRAEQLLPGKLLSQTDQVTRLALVAADWALADADVEPDQFSDFDMGVITASTTGGIEFAQNELRQLWSKGSRFVSSYQSFAWFYAVNSGQISIRHKMRGPSGVMVGDEAGGLDAIGQARRQIRKGTNLIVTGAIDASICPWAWAALCTTGLVSTSGDPTRAFLPFDRRACGYVPGEGGAILVVESADRAGDRGARPYGEVAGYGATFDPRPGTGREPGLRKAIELALTDAGVVPDEVDVVLADAAGTPALDQIEAEAITGVFGPRGVPVTAPKTTTGRLLSGAGPVDVVSALLAMAHRVIPPTVHVDPAYDDLLDLVVETARPAQLHTALVLARGYGGFNAAVLLRGAGANDSSG